MPKRVEVVDRVQVAHAKLLEGFSCTADAVPGGARGKSLEQARQELILKIRSSISNCLILLKRFFIVQTVSTRKECLDKA